MIHRNVYKVLGRSVAILVLAVGLTAGYLLRGGFNQFEITAYPVSPPAFDNWNDALAHPRDISVTTFRTGVIHMDTCLNLDSESPRQADCDHAPRDLEALVHWVQIPDLGDFLVDSGFDDSFAKHPPYGNYTKAMRLFKAGVAPRGWNKAGTARGYISLEQLRAFARAYPNVRIIYGHEVETF